MLNLVNTIQTELFQLGPSNLVHRLLMTRGLHLLTFKVMGQRSWVKRYTLLINDFQGQGSKVKVTYLTLLLNLLNKINPFYFANYNVIVS